MADYCENCAKELGFEAEYDASPCEGCGRTVYKQEKEWSKILKVLIVIILFSAFMSLLFS